MTLPMHDRQVLAQIEKHFMTQDPELALLLSTFGASRSIRHRIALALRHHAGAVVAYAAVTAAAMLLVAACATQSVAVLIGAGGMALAVGVAKLTAYLRATFGRRAHQARCRDSQG
ncbi:DUF3040 domain-containing protein [Streptomyces sp. Edi2]|uniref:DUF3040 domain-containing protein n=1 Tax=Streptomyces sp. Edi2 TaxID=3162528 RepID=UPI0033066ED7